MTERKTHRYAGHLHLSPPAALFSLSPLCAALLSVPVYAEDSLDTISVTASRIEKASKAVPGSLAVIDQDRIESAKMHNIKEAIEGTPGVLINSKSGGYDVRLMIRGAGQKANYGVREIMVLRDGVPMTDPDSFSRFDFIDTQDIERIEITKGPGSLYGSGSAGGTIQIISKSVFDDRANRIRISGGNDGAQSYNLRYSGEVNEDNSLALTVSRRVLDNDWRAWNQFDTNQVSLKHGVILEDGSPLETEISYSEANMQLPGSMSAEQFETFKQTGEQTDNQDAWKHSGRYSKIWFFNSRLEKEVGDWLFKPRVYMNSWEHFHPVTGAINDNPGTNVFGTDLEFSRQHQAFGAQADLVFGFTARLDSTDESKKYAYGDVRTLPNGRIIATLSDRRGELLETEASDISLYGVYLQETLRPAPNWSIDAGFRLDKANFDIQTEEYRRYDYARGTYADGAGTVSTDKNFTLFSPRLGVTYTLTPQINAYAVVAQSDQLPSESEIQKNADLNASQARNIEIGLKGRARAWSFDLSLYHTEVSDEIVATIQNGETLFQNAGKTLKDGLEFSGRLNLSQNLWLGAGYAYSDYRFDNYQEVSRGRILDYNGKQLPYVPRQQYNLSAGYNHASGFKARLQANSWGSYYLDNANSEKYGGYDFVTNLMLAYERGAHSLSLNVDNLFDKRYAVEVKKGNNKTYYAAGAPRSVMLSYAYQF